MPSTLKNAANHSVLEEHLQGLRRAGRELATTLDQSKIVIDNRSLKKSGAQDIRRGDGVLYRQIDADAADRRHGVSRIADAQQAGPMPNPQAIDRNGQQLDVGPIAELTDAITQIWGEARDLLAKALQAVPLNLIEPSLRNHVTRIASSPRD